MIRPRERRLIVLALLIAGVVAVWRWVYLPFAAKDQHERDRIHELRGNLISNHTLLLGGKGYKAEVQALTSDVKSLEGRLFSGEKTALLGAKLQKLFKDLAEQNGLAVKSEQVLEPESLQEILVIPVEIVLSGNMKQLTGFLHGIEAAPTLYRIDRLNIKVPNMRAPGQIAAVVRIYGYLLPGGA